MNIEIADRGVLSPKEAEVLRLSGFGLSHKAIARKLHRSVKTVDRHFENIHAKLCTKNGAETIGVSVARGILRIFCLALVMVSVQPPEDQPDMRRVRLRTSVRVVRLRESS